jgi:hypothetical protein
MRLFRIAAVVVAAGLLSALGCSKSGPKFVKVSGVVTVNGVPYPNAVVTFQPMGTEDNPNPGRGPAVTPTTRAGSR